MNADTAGSIQDLDQLYSILSRPVTMANAHHSPVVDDDIRMLQRVRPTFIGRSAYVWETKTDDEAHFATAKRWADRIHTEVDSDIVLQASIFEAIYPEVNEIPIPAWVFEDMGQDVEERNFVYDDFFGKVQRPDQGLSGGPWDGGGVPDLSCPETQRWFYYRGRRYIEAGYEAIHLGQMHLVCGADTGFRSAQFVCGMIKKAAAAHARRGFVLLDGHGHGMSINGQLLFDFTSRPMSARCLVQDFPRIALIKRGESIGGTLPGGVHVPTSPTIVEIDNWCGYSLAPGAPEWDNLHELANFGRWGYDEICWFARLPVEERPAFLRYAHRWTRLQNDNWFFQPVLTRSLGKANVDHPNAGVVHRYRANNESEACPGGFNDEDHVRAIWEEDTRFLKPDAPALPHPQTPSGVDVPEPVNVMGGLQPYLGGVPGDASCPWSRLVHIGDGKFARTFVVPVKGIQSFFVTVGGTNADPTKANTVAGGPLVEIDIPAAGTVVRIHFDYETRTIDVTNVETGTSIRI